MYEKQCISFSFLCNFASRFYQYFMIVLNPLIVSFVSSSDLILNYSIKLLSMLSISLYIFQYLPELICGCEMLFGYSIRSWKCLFIPLHNSNLFNSNRREKSERLAFVRRLTAVSHLLPWMKIKPESDSLFWLQLIEECILQNSVKICKWFIVVLTVWCSLWSSRYTVHNGFPKCWHTPWTSTRWLLFKIVLRTNIGICIFVWSGQRGTQSRAVLENDVKSHIADKVKTLHRSENTYTHLKIKYSSCEEEKVTCGFLELKSLRLLCFSLIYFLC